jgi:hypothetical protein
MLEIYVGFRTPHLFRQFLPRDHFAGATDQNG